MIARSGAITESASAADGQRAARRARREERRTRQRAQNVVRAKQMHVARLEFKESAASSGDGAPTIGRDGKTLLARVGCSGWYYWHWRNAFYPAELPGNRWFSHYARRFNTVELNAPFYSWPTLATVKTWLRQIGGRKFAYTIKVNELITHTKRFARTATMVRDFGLIADLLDEHFGCFLFQLPPSFHYSAAALQRILKQLDPRRRNVVEFRHSSWWNERVYRAFQNTGTIFCSTSGPRLPDELIRTADDIYVRFHGTQHWYRHDYSPQELSVWTKRIQQSGAARVWAYFNNDREGYAIKNARELRRQLLAARPRHPLQAWG